MRIILKEQTAGFDDTYIEDEGKEMIKDEDQVFGLKDWQKTWSQ